jgi:antirestriction protein ArdC
MAPRPSAWYRPWRKARRDAGLARPMRLAVGNAADRLVVTEVFREPS